MATKTITLEIDAYERLKRAKRTPRESFSEVVRRLPMPAGALTAGQYLALAGERGALLTEDDARAIDELNLADQPPRPWPTTNRSSRATRTNSGAWPAWTSCRIESGRCGKARR